MMLLRILHRVGFSVAVYRNVPSLHLFDGWSGMVLEFCQRPFPMDIFPWFQFCLLMKQTIWPTDSPFVIDAVQKLFTGVDELLFYSCYTNCKSSTNWGWGCVHTRVRALKVGSVIVPARGTELVPSSLFFAPWAIMQAGPWMSLLNTSSESVISVRRSCSFAAVPHWRCAS